MSDLSSLTIAIAAFMMQVGARHITFDMTNAQRKLMQNPFAKGAVLLAMFFVTTRNILASIGLTLVYFAMTLVLLNEYNDFNIYSRPWLAQNGFVKDTQDSHSHMTTTVEAYKNNINKLLYG